MAKHEVIQNIFDGGGALDVYDRKYLKYFTDDYTDRVSVNVFNALKSKDINVIEDCLKDISNTTTNFMMLIGLSCLIVERERLYEGTEYGISYLRYADHLFDEMNIPASTLSEAKIIVENYIDHYRQLSKAGFKLARNAMKLRYLPEALENHQETEVYNRIVNDTFRGFREWAQRKNIARVHKPGPQTRVDVAIKGNKLLVKGKNILNFPKGLSDDIRSMVAGDLEKTFSIREGGNEPYIIETYGRGEQAAINNFLKQHRSKK